MRIQSIKPDLMRRSNFAGAVFISLALLVLAVSEGRADGEVRPRNVILLIGDGMGLSQVSVPYYYGDEEPAFNRFRYIGLQRTSAANAPVTQSSAAATALSTGVKTYNLAIGVDTDTIPRENLVEKISRKGFMTGVIATSTVIDATPAGFYAHQPDRYLQRAIAQDLLKSEIDFFAGGGIKHFLDTTGVDVFKENNIIMDYSGIRRIRKPEPGMRYGFLLAADRMPAILEGRKDFLWDATKVGIDFLSGSGEGYFLMVEGSQIDWAGHGNNANYMVTEMNDFNRVVTKVLDYAEKDGQTLVVVTADHETGGFTLGAAGENGYDADYSTIAPTFATTNHSAALVPVFAYGPGAEHFLGVYENTEIFHKLLYLLTGQRE